MIYRKEDKDGDYVFGEGDSEFLTQSEAVAQAIITSLKLLKGEWWENVNNGLPLWQSILGQPGSEVNKASVDNIIKSRILETNLNGIKLVNTINEYSSEFNPTSRKYNFRAKVTTIYSQEVSVQDNLLINEANI